MAPGATTNHAFGNRNGGHHGSFNSALDAWGSDPDHHPDCSLHALNEGSVLFKNEGKKNDVSPNTNPPSNEAEYQLGLDQTCHCCCRNRRPLCNLSRQLYNARSSEQHHAAVRRHRQCNYGPEWRGARQSPKSSISARADRSAQYPVGRGARGEPARRNAAGNANRSWREQLAVVSLYSYSMLECT
jgi:hypothetical protein